MTEPTCVQILQPGYRVGERILRPARVAVAEPGSAEESDGPDEPDDAPDEEGGQARIHHQPGGATSGGESRAEGRRDTRADDD